MQYAVRDGRRRKYISESVLSIAIRRTRSQAVARKNSRPYCLTAVYILALLLAHSAHGVTKHQGND